MPDICAPFAYHDQQRWATNKRSKINSGVSAEVWVDRRHEPQRTGARTALSASSGALIGADIPKRIGPVLKTRGVMERADMAVRAPGLVVSCPSE